MMSAIVAMGMAAGAFGCGEDGAEAVDPRTAERELIDRFSEAAGTWMVRTEGNGLPGPNVAIDYDEARFVMEVLAPDGRRATVYNFDLQATTPAPIYVFFEDGHDTPVRGQLNVVTVVPGVVGYNDLWQVVKVDVPEGYVANSVTSYDEIVAAGYTMTTMPMLVNCPVVPEGSVARKRMAGDYAELTQGWYEGKIIQYFHFGEKVVLAVDGQVPTSDVYVAFNINPGEPGGGPASGFRTEAGGAKTHNVLATTHQDAGYSPLWRVHAYDNASFDDVRDLATAQAAPAIALDGVVNAPIVAIGQ
jgi:hypothetical protein